MNASRILRYVALQICERGIRNAAGLFRCERICLRGIAERRTFYHSVGLSEALQLGDRAAF